jgi:serine/threonine protein kinase
VFRPTTFGKYFLTRRLAVGGMAEVFQAKLYGADGFEKDLVIKQILPQYARDPEFVQSFVAEAKIAVTLNHANIVGIYELGRVDGTYFIAMEYVDGLDVFSTIDAAKRHGRKISIGSSALIVEEVAKGLDYAHRKVGPDGLPLGLVHRDLNPRNVLISTEGDVKILDFGIAKTASAVAAMPKTRAGVVKGTTGYMSPEQATGREIDSRTDIYQAGLLLFELLTGVPLFWRPDDQQTRELMRQHRVVAPSRLVKEVPPELDRIVIRCLDRDPNARYQSAAELAAEVGRVRFTRHPEAHHRAIGTLVAELMRLDTAEREVSAQALPSTQELHEVISNAIEQSISGDIVTIATRTPSGVEAPETPPVTGSMPLEMPAETIAPPPPPTPTAKKGPALAIAVGAAAFALAGLGTIYAMRAGEEVVAATVPIDAGVVAAQASPPDAALEIAQASVDAAIEPQRSSDPADAGATEESAPPPPPTRKPSKRRAPPLEAGFGMVDFGTRSCSSRVSVDGRVIARSTPSFDHKLPAGTHRVVLEGTGCSAIEQPGSLRRTVPTVATTIQVVANSSLKVIADFEHDTVIVRDQ